MSHHVSQYDPSCHLRSHSLSYARDNFFFHENKLITANVILCVTENLTNFLLISVIYNTELFKNDEYTASVSTKMISMPVLFAT